MEKVTISKTRYERLKKQAEAYKKFAADFYSFAMGDMVEEVVDDFKNTGIYTEGFLNDLEDGLKKSSYNKKYGNKAFAGRSKKVHQRA